MRKFQKECTAQQPKLHATEVHRALACRRMTGLAVAAMAASFFCLPFSGSALTVATAGTAATVASNQNQGSNPAMDGPQGEVSAGVRVVRLSDVEGDVRILRGNQTEFSHALMNMPLPEGSRIETGAQGRAEIEFEDGSVARITPNSSLNIAKLTTTPDGSLATTLQQNAGLVYYELRSDPKAPYTVIVGKATVVPAVNSTFRVNLGATPPELAVIDGRVQVQGASGEYQAAVNQGKTIEFHPSAGAQYTIADGIIPNGFDQWNDQRDEEAAQEAANQTPARVQQGAGSIMDSGIGAGWGDLDTYGGWYPLPGYGMVWQPYGVGAGFDPYGFGDWADIGGFGVSWISGYPWGWLPFQCGGWSYIGSFGWGWMPGGCGFGGIGYGGYGYWRRRHGYTNIYRGPAGYRRPVPPTGLRTSVHGSRPGENLVHIGSSQLAGDRRMGGNAGRLDRSGFAGNTHQAVNSHRTVNYHGMKIAPLHSMMAGVHVPVRNAALYNNYPARAYPGGVRSTLMDRNGGMDRSTRGASNRLGGFQAHDERSRGNFGRSSISTREGAMNAARSRTFAGHSFGGDQSFREGRSFEGTNRGFGDAGRESFGNHTAFGQHTTFGSHGSFGGMHSSFQGGSGFRGGAMSSGMRSGGGFHSGATNSGGGFHGGGMSAGGGFHGGGMSGGGGGHGGGGGGHGR